MGGPQVRDHELYSTPLSRRDCKTLVFGGGLMPESSCRSYAETNILHCRRSVRGLMLLRAP